MLHLIICFISLQIINLLNVKLNIGSLDGLMMQNHLMKGFNSFSYADQMSLPFHRLTFKSIDLVNNNIRKKQVQVGNKLLTKLILNI